MTEEIPILRTNRRQGHPCLEWLFRADSRISAPKSGRYNHVDFFYSTGWFYVIMESRPVNDDRKRRTTYIYYDKEIYSIDRESYPHKRLVKKIKK